MATFTTNTNNTYYAVLTCTETGISGNTSKVAYSLTLYNGNNAFDGYTIGYEIYINGTQVAYHNNSGNQTAMSKYSSKLVVSGTTSAISHNSDGTKSVSVSVKIWTDNIYYLPVSLSASGTMALTDTAYPVTYYANGGSNAPSAGTKYYNTTYYITSSAPTRNGYNFLGWSTSSNATSPSYYSGSSYTSNSALNLYAVWEVANGKSTITLSGGIINLDSPFTLYTIRQNTSNTHTIVLTLPTGSYTLATGVGASHTFTLPASTWARYFTDSKFVGGTITVTTYSGSTNLGSVSQGVTVALPENIGKPDKPTAILSTEHAASAIIDLKKPTFKYGATFKEWQIETNIGKAKIIGNRVHIGVDPTINKAGVVTVRAVDSRGFMSDPVSVQWHRRKTGGCVFMNGMWR